MSDNNHYSGSADQSNFKKKPRKMVYQLRMNEDESELLDMISYETDDTKADVIRKALKMYASAKRNGF